MKYLFGRRQGTGRTQREGEETAAEARRNKEVRNRSLAKENGTSKCEKCERGCEWGSHDESCKLRTGFGSLKVARWRRNAGKPYRGTYTRSSVNVSQRYYFR